jgi:hypothetical protein
MLNIFPQPLCSDDFYPLPIAFTNPDGTPKDLSGKTLGLTVKDEPTDSNDVTQARFYQNIFGDTTGQVVFAIRGLGAGLYWMDVKIWTTSAVPSDRQTVIPPVQMKIIQSVTTRST